MINNLQGQVYKWSTTYKVKFTNDQQLTRSSLQMINNLQGHVYKWSTTYKVKFTNISLKTLGGLSYVATLEYKSTFLSHANWLRPKQLPLYFDLLLPRGVEFCLLISLVSTQNSFDKFHKTTK